MKFSIGYSGQRGFLETVARHAADVSSVYFPMPGEVGPSGRDVGRDADYPAAVSRMMALCRRLGIETILLLNAGCEGRDSGSPAALGRYLRFAGALVPAGLGAVSVSNPLHIPEIRFAFPGLKIFASVNSPVTTVEQAIYYRDLGADVVTAYRDVNRDLPLLRAIKERSGLELQVIANEFCMRGCPFYRVHSNIQSHGVDGDENLVAKNGCIGMYRRDRRLFFRGQFVRPEEVWRYEGLVDHMKLSTRGANPEWISLSLRAYAAGEYRGDLLDVLDVYREDEVRAIVGPVDNVRLTELGFFDRMLRCPGDCAACGACDELFPAGRP